MALLLVAINTFPPNFDASSPTLERTPLPKRIFVGI
jgi:hypothetical protein